MDGLTQFLRRFRVRGRALVVGSKQYRDKVDRRGLYKKATGMDMLAGDGVDIVHDLETPYAGQFDHIDCVSVLEHVKRPWLMAENIEQLMAPGATILVSVPFIWRVHAYPSDYWRMTIEALPILFPNVEWLERGYMAGDVLVKKPGVTNLDGHLYMQKTEAIAFGAIRNFNHT